MNWLIGLVVWTVIGKLIVWSYRRKYCSKYPFLKKLQELEDEEVNEFRAEVYPVVRFILDCLFGFIELLIWPYDIYTYRRWAKTRINYYNERY